MDNDTKNSGFVLWSNKHTWEELTDTWAAYDKYLYIRMDNDTKY